MYKRQVLDKGLEKTRTSVFSRITKAIAGKSSVDDDVLDDLEEILVTSDVGVQTTLKIISRIQERVARYKYPVSYTHLDVYKRQGRTPCNFRRCTDRFLFL